MRPEQMTTKMKSAKSSNFDRLSDLRDDLLLHIMRSLKPQQAVQTCVLSKRWKNLWRDLTCLEFDLSEINSRYKIIDFINSFLMFRNTSPIETFRLDWGLNSSIPELTRRWICYVLECQPRMISITDLLVKRLPQSLMTCASLETMQLHTSLLPQTKTIALLSLKRLTLDSVVSDGESVMNLISGCPVLEDLVLKHCYIKGADITITSLRLRNLNIQYLFAKDFGIYLSVPNLMSLNVTNAILGKIWLKDMLSLVEARIHFCNSDSAAYQKSRYELLSALSNVKYLELMGTRIYVEESAFEVCLLVSLYLSEI
jgi:Leucine Rich Repeat